MTQAVMLTAIRAALVAAHAYAPPPPPPPPSSALPTLTFTSSTSGRRPWACGQVFKRGAVPMGSTLSADCAGFQITPVSYHDDMSLRFARIAGFCDVQAVPNTVTIRLSLAGGSTSAPAYVRTRDPVTISLNGVARNVTKTKVIAAGPQMTHEQMTCKIDAQLAFVYEVRAFANGSFHVLVPCAENCGFTALSQPMRSGIMRFDIDGVTGFEAAVDVKHHTRIPLVGGSDATSSRWEWHDGDAPTGTIQHDLQYLCECETFPPYACVAADPKLFTAVHPPGHPLAGQLVIRQHYTPNFIGEGGPAMADTGYDPHIGLLARSNLYALTTGGARPWNYMMTEAFSSGSWSTHLRDELTGELPLPSAYPNHTWQSNIPKGSGATNGVADIAHQPQLVYTAALLSGWQWFADEAASWVTFNHFYQQPPNRQLSMGIIRTDVGTNQDRGAAWALRSLGQAIAVLDHNTTLAGELRTIMENNAQYYVARFVDGTTHGGAFLNDIGVIAPYSSSGTSLYAGGDRGSSLAWWGAGWMQSFITQSLGHLVQLSLPISSAARSDLRDVFMQSAKLIVGLCGATHWRRFGVYAMPFWADGLKVPPPMQWFDMAQMWAEYERAKGLTTLDPAPGGTLKQHSTNVDVNATDWTTGRIGVHWPALVYAVMHGAPGADAALARIMSSASWPLIAASVQNPIWAGMMPPGIKHPGAP